MDIEIRGLTKRYGSKTVFEDLTLTLPEGKTCFLLGPSGCGKTTLFSLIMGFEAPDSGRIRNVPRKLSCVFQEDRLCEDFTAEANILAVLPRTASVTATELQRIREELRRVGLGDCSGKPVRTLSGGQKRRVAIVRAMLAEAELLLLDEPLKGLDKETKAQVCAYIREHICRRTAVIITHEEEEIPLLGGGPVFRMGTPDHADSPQENP